MRIKSLTNAVIAGAIALILAGCNSAPHDIFSIPVTGQLSNGSAAFGQATARSDGLGTFWVKVPGAERCGGNYRVGDSSQTSVVPVLCNDGRSGEAVITRQADLMSGSAIVKLSDGTKGQFVFGDIHFDQTFGRGGTAHTY